MAQQANIRGTDTIEPGEEEAVRAEEGGDFDEEVKRAVVDGRRFGTQLGGGVEEGEEMLGTGGGMAQGEGGCVRGDRDAGAGEDVRVDLEADLCREAQQARGRVVHGE